MSIAIRRSSPTCLVCCLSIRISQIFFTSASAPKRQLGSSSFNQPVGGFEMPRSGGIATMFRLPVQKESTGLDACFLGIPFDSATSYRPGTRGGPRQIRGESAFLKAFNLRTGAAPFESMQVADIGDIAVNPYNVSESMKIIEARLHQVIRDGCVPMTLGGDHLITLPILRAVSARYGPVAVVHVDAHSDTYDSPLGLYHGSTFRAAVEEGLLVNNKVWQIGLRGTGYQPEDYTWGKEKGFTVVEAPDLLFKSLRPVMDDIRHSIGNHPTYISFDIDALDPAFAPGTGTPEIGGLTPGQALEIIRGCRGLNIVGCDLVEVSPPYDPMGTTALVGANLLFEMLCVLPKVK